MKHRIAIVGLLLLSGCAANVLRLESAGSLSAASSAVVEASRASLNEARARRQRANSIVVASDTSCPAARVIHIRTLPGDLCASVAGSDTVEFDTEPLTQAQLQPTLVMIAALADYSAALNKIVEDPKPDISAELGALAKKAGEAAALANGLLGSNLPDPQKLLATDQSQAALKLVQLAADLAHEAAQVDRLRALVKARDPEIAELTANLETQVRTWNEMAKLDAQTSASRLETVYNKEARRRPFEQRLAFVELVNSARADVAGTDARAKAMTESLKLLREARQQLSEYLQGKFDQKAKERIARLNEARIINAIKILAAAVPAF